MKDGLVCRFHFLQNLSFRKYVVNSEFEFDRLELSMVIQNVVVVTNSYVVIVCFYVDYDLFSLGILGAQIQSPNRFHVLLVDNLQ